MKGKKNMFLRRAGAWALSAAMAVPLVLGALPPISARAAGDVTLEVKLVDYDSGSGIPQGLGRMEARDLTVYDVTEFYRQEPVEIPDILVYEPVKDTNGVTTGERLIGSLYDYKNSYYGTDGTGEPMSLYEAATTAYKNVLIQKPAGSTTFKRESYPDGEIIMQYATIETDNGIHTYDSCRIDTDPDIDRDKKVDSWSVECLQNHARKVTGLSFRTEHDANGTTLVIDGLSEGHVYVVLENDNKRVSAYCYAPNVYDNTYHTFHPEIYYGSLPADVVLDESIYRYHNVSAVTLANKVWRGGFTFQVKDVETGLGSLQSMGMPENSLFAVFNISDSAVSPDSYEDMTEIRQGKDPQLKASVTKDTSRYGKVYVAANGYSFTYGVSNALSAEPDRAYSYDDIMKAYEKYLSDSWNGHYTADQMDVVKYVTREGDEVPFYNGMYGYGNYSVLTPFRRGDITSGKFVMGKDSKGADIIPCAMLSADAAGNVSTGPAAFPAGNYLVLQVRSTPGYYIDENFRLAVSVGPWYNGHDLDNTSLNGNPYETISSGYGNALFNQFSYTLRDTSAMAAKEFDDSNRFRNVAGLMRLDKYPAAYVPATAFDTELAMISTESCQGFGVNSIGGVGGYGIYDGGRGIDYRSPDDNSGNMPQGMGNEGRYIIAPSDPGTSTTDGVGSRRYPKAGTSRLTAWMAPVRAGVSFKITDAYDLQEFRADNPDAAAGYATSAQGDAKLEGAVFRLYHDRGNADGSLGSYVPNAMGGAGREGVNKNYTTNFGVPGVNGSQAMANSTNNTWANKSGSYKEYTSIRLPNGEYIVNIPVDDLVYGEYTLVQVAGGEGYGLTAKAGNEWAAHREEELAAWVLRVVSEDTVYVRYGGKELNDKKDEDTPLNPETIAKHTIGDTVYLPNTPYIGDGIVSVNVLGGSGEGISAQVSVYNISDSHIYIGSGYDEDGNFVSGKEIKTAQASYKSGIEGKPNINMGTLKDIVSGAGWSDALIWSGSIAAGSSESDNLKGLPYGTYLAAVTGVTGEGDYMPTTSAAAIFQVRSGGMAVCSIMLGDKARMPVVSGELLDGATNTKSVTVGIGGSLDDNILLGNLQPDTKYAVYGILVDTATGAIVPGTKVATAQASGFISSGNGSGAAGDTSLSNLVAIGQKFSDGEINFNDDGVGTESYTTWLMGVREFVGSLDDSISSKSELKDMVDNMLCVPPVYSWTQTHSRLMGSLKYLLNNAGDAGLTGMAEIDLQFTGADVRGLEGHVLASYIFICEDVSINPAAAGAVTLADLQAAVGKTMVAVYPGSDFAEQSAQAAYVPSLAVEVTGLRSGGGTVDPSDGVRADISYGNLEPNAAYRLDAYLTDSDGLVLRSSVDPTQDLVLSRDFVASGASGRESIAFDEIDLSVYDGGQITAHAKLYRVVSAADASSAYLLLEKSSDDGVGISKPIASGRLTDSYGYKETDFSVSEVSLRNTMNYNGLVPGQTYEAVSYLVYPDGTTVQGVGGSEAAGWTRFTARSTDVQVNVDVKFDGRRATDKTVIAFNDLYVVNDGETAASPSVQIHDLRNEDQTVTDSNPGGRIYLQVTAKDDGTKTQYATVSTSAGITVSVQAQGLDAGASYVMKVLMADAGNGQAVPQSEEKVLQVKASEGGMVNADVKVSLNTSILTGRTLTAYATILDASGYETVAEFKDNADKAAQIYVPALAAQLTGSDGKAKTVWPEKVEDNKTNVTVGADGELKTDVTTTYRYDAKVRVGMSYGNLVVGNPYTVKIQVQPKDGGGTLATYDGAFSPENASGDAYFDFTVDVSKYMDKDLVATIVLTDDYTKRTVLQLNSTDDPERTVHVGIPGSEDDPNNKPTGSGNSAGEKPTGSGNSAGTGPVSGGSSGGGSGNGGSAIQTGVDERYTLYFIISGILAVLAAGTGAGAVAYKKKGAFWRK